MNRRWAERLLVVLVCAAIGRFYLWTVESGAGAIRFSGKQTDYYNLLIDGWQAGQLHMKIDVPAELLALKDPYDPAQRPPGLGLHDASLFHGKYYLYFGAVPAAVLMLPFRLVTGADLPMPAAVLIFTLGGFGASVAAWRMIRRRFFSEAGAVAVLGAVVALGLAGLGPVLLRRPLFWELPIAGAYCFAMLALCSLLRAMEDESRAVRWLAVASTCLGFAVGSRITYLVVTPMLLAPLVWRWRQRGRWPWREVVSAVLPLVVIGAALAWHNYARFGDPLEFGQRYQLNSRYEVRMTNFAARYVPYNAWLYFWGPAQWTRYFPFIDGLARPAEPAGYGGVENVYGVLANLPLAWFALAAPLALRRREPTERAALAAGLGAVAALFVANAGLLMFFFGAHGRYMLDFTPALMLLACVGVLAVGRELGRLPQPWWRWPVRAVVVGAVVFSAGFAVLFSLTTTDIFPKNNPRGYRELAERLNQIAAWGERIAGVRHGPVELTLRLPTRGRRRDERQALLVAGVAPRRDTVFVQYEEPGQVRFGFAQEGGGSQLSRSVTLDRAQPHRVRIALGSFWPPDTHPVFRGLAPGETARLKREVVITVDDETVFESQARFGLASVAPVQVAPQLDDNVLGHPFTGEVLAVRREAQPAATALASRECVRLRMTLPTAPVDQSLLRVGLAEQGAELSVRRSDGGHVTFGWRAPGAAPVVSAPVPVENQAVHEVLIKVARPSSADPAAMGVLQVVLDGVLAWSRRVVLPAASEVNLSPALAGQIFSEERFMDEADPLLMGRGAMRLALRFPRDRGGRARDPVVVTGRSGEGDFLFVEYGDDGRLRFGFDHWGDSRLMISEPIAVDRAAAHELEIALGSLPRESAVGTRKSVPPGQVRVTLDGVTVFDVETAFHSPARGELYVGRNPIGGSSCGPAFSGDLLRAGRELPPVKE